jgi:acyl transferase domain-containing protein/NAD(P)-dependent dehydrogenase (short-subunit alcohol dehydrogenase family)/aryl carrier-like protein
VSASTLPHVSQESCPGDEGLWLISERGRLIGELPEGGRMLAVFAPLAAVEDSLKADQFAGRLSLAAGNGTHIVVSGDEDAIQEIEQQFSQQQIRTKALTTSHAFHSHLMDPALEPFRAVADGINFQAPQLPLVCNMSARVLAPDTVLDGAFWAQHIRAAVRFSESIETAQEQGCDLVLEIGPNAVLTRMAAAVWKHSSDRLISCLTRGTEDRRAWLTALGRLYVNGVTPDFAAMHQGASHQRVLLPTYPFQRRRFWGPDKPRAFHAEFHTAHPLLGGRMTLAGVADETRFESFVEPDSPPWLPDHEVMGRVVMPGAAFVEMALAAADGGCLQDVTFEQPLQPASRTALQTVLRGKGDSPRTMESFSSAAGSVEWTRHFTANLLPAESAAAERVDRAAHEQACPHEADVDAFYQKLQEVGLNYGPAFQTVRSLRYSESHVLATLAIQGDIRGFIVPPPLLDGALHCMAVGLLQQDDGNLFLPVGMDRVTCLRPIEQQVHCFAEWREGEGKVRKADLQLYSDSGELLLEIDGLRVQQVNRAALRQMSGGGAARLTYEIQWQPTRPGEPVQDKKNVLLLAPDSATEFTDEIAAELTRRGHVVAKATWQRAGDLHHLDQLSWGLNGSDGEQWVSLFRNLSAEDLAFEPDGIIIVPDEPAPAAGDDPLAATRGNCESLLNLVKAIHESVKQQVECGVQLVTVDAVATADASACRPEQAQYWGFGRVLGAEYPELRCRLIDVASTDVTDHRAAEFVADILLTETRDNQFAVRDGQCLVPRLRPFTTGGRKRTEFSVRSDASYLITGGLGKLGRQAARWLADQGASQVVLVSRRSPDEQTTAWLNQIQAAGCDVIVHCGDLGERRDTEELFERFSGDLLPLGGVIHAAGILDDGLIGEQSWPRYEKVLLPKVAGARLLDEFTRSIDLDFFILYSSVAAVLGPRGQSNYAMANAFMDGLAWQRRSLGLPATTVNWGAWSEGMADDEQILRRLALQGMTPLAPSEAHDALQLALTTNVVQASVMDVDWRRMRIGMGGQLPEMLAALAPDRQKRDAAESALVSQLKRLPEAARQELLVSTIQEMLQTVLATPEAPETDRPLIEMGLDSLMAVEFSTQLQMTLGEQYVVGPTMLFDHPTIDAIALHVREMITSDGDTEEAPASSAPAEPAAAELRQREPVAIIGMSCRFPGADNVDQFWQNLLNGVDSVREIPGDRWDIDRFYSADRQPGRMYTKEGGFLEDIGHFDAAFFNISDQEACWIDPQHRMLLENSYRALEDAGIPPSPLADPNVGVFMGIMGQDYAFLPSLDDESIIGAFQGAGLSHSAGVGRISYVFGFEGPSIAVDTASSSSLVAVYQAVRSLQDGNCNLALAGGVNAILAPVNSLLMSKAGLLAPDGRCKSFSATADGFGRGEGCGVVVLKRLSDAERDGDNVLAIVKGGAVVHNGFTGGITSPSGKAQARVISQALKDAEVAPSQVQYLEAHGTGTEFGDPMEIGAASSVYGKGRKSKQPLLVGSVKANISHLEAAGGISGLIKTVLCLQHGVIPPQVHFDAPSPHIPWNRSRVRVVTETTEWPECEQRMAAVTALGLVGTNAHLILSEPPRAAATVSADQNGESDASSAPRCQLLPLSARDADTLREVIAGYSRLVEQNPALDLNDLCHSAGAARQHFLFRAAVTASSLPELSERLTELLQASAADTLVTAAHSAPRVAWLMTGDPFSDRTAAQQMYADQPVFREVIRNLNERLKSHLEEAERPAVSLIDWFGDGDCDCDGASVYTFAMYAGLSALWRSWGVEPDTLLGIGPGQYAAAAVAGGVSMEDAMLLVVEADHARRQIAERPAEQDSILDAFEKFADSLNYYPPNRQLVCSLSGEIVAVHRSLGGSYWRSYVESTGLAESISALHASGCDLILQLGPDNGMDSMQDADVAGRSLRRICVLAEAVDAGQSLLEALGQLYVAGVNPDFAAVPPSGHFRRIRLPHYPFHRKRYWITEIDRYVSGQDPAAEMSQQVVLPEGSIR